MERNHMLAPTRDRESASSHDAVLGPPPPLPTPHMMGFSPPAYSPSSHVGASIFSMPDVPNTELPPPLSRQLPPLSHRDADIKLPSLSSLTGDLALGPPGSHWPHMNPLPPYHPSAAPQLYQGADSPIKMDMDTSSNSVVSAASPDHLHDARSGSVSLDDPDVRLAAEALGDLRADFVSSPPNRNSSLPVSPPTSSGFQTSGRTRTQSPQPEPLLSLLTTSHPLLASTIEGATSAYGGAKNFSPRFRSGAEYVEGYLTPIANTVGSVGRRTGVEGGVRWFLGAGRRQNSSSDLETGNGSKKRRKVDNSQSVSNKRVEGEGMKQIGGLQHLPSEAGAQQDSFSPSSKMGSRRMSTTSTIDTLPAYDEIRSPAYTETADAESSPRPSNGAWQSRLIMSTSGLSIAMSDESLRSLKYCLRWLKWANSHMGRVIGALKDTLEQFDKEEATAAPHLQATEKEDVMGEPSNAIVNSQDQSRKEIAARIASLKGDVLKTLQEVIITVSKYAGGALPENARILVRRHLTSLPQRFRVATMSDNAAQGNDADSESALREGAQKVLVLAKEGLDMVAQVSGVLDGTIVSAEEWCERMGKRRRNQDEEKLVLPQTQTNNDVKMG
ncbi:transcription factor Opi1-domain-containing protein [Dactylonectria macrodidyma]|uniref:Transcription factor Opi1-domain-containing protein n=1 Tax=Dactylonectria macrodidyma TaxID=307937 RepID=A0A9P9JJX2_9HYPO|nr:transcription factor Opi1-domain-containing protein [Dactylonectria macrodidyma]